MIDLYLIILHYNLLYSLERQNITWETALVCTNLQNHQTDSDYAWCAEGRGGICM